LHDGLSSLLAAIKIQFNSIQATVPDLHTHSKYAEALSALDEASREVRRIAHNMMPEMLAKYGLIEALDELIHHLQDRIDISFSHFGMDQPLDPQVELALYRMIQELLNNILKHSQATEALLQLNRHADHLSLTVEDNGQGFDPDRLHGQSGLGLANLQSRVQLLQGNLNLESRPGRGTSVFIDIPLSPTSLLV
ncbi:MAG: sensor histidine kinase, partial [Bacteroidetes bacterium]